MRSRQFYVIQSDTAKLGAGAAVCRMLHAAHTVSGRLAVSLPFESFFFNANKLSKVPKPTYGKPTQLGARLSERGGAAPALASL